MARPTKLTKEVHRRIVSAIRQGATYQLASQYGGIHYDTFNEWMKQGQAETEGIYSEFSDAVKKAEGDAVVKWLKVIEAAGKDNWQAMAWKLERRYPRDYGKQVQEHIGDSDNPVQLNVVYGKRTNNQSEATSQQAD